MPADVLTQSEAQLRAGVLSNVRYAVHLDLSDDMTQKTYSSTTVVSFDAAENAESFLNFEGEGTEVWLNGRRLAADCFDGKRIRLQGLKASGNEVRVVAAARYQTDGVGLHRIQDPADGEVYLYTHFEPFDAHLVFACFDQPDLKAPTTLSVTAPPRWLLVANNAELRTEAQPDGRVTHHFATTKPISTYLDAVVAGPYERVTSSYTSALSGKTIELGLHCRKSMLPYLETDDIFEITRQGLAYYEEFFGLPYPFEKYDQVFVAESNMGAMENPGCVTFNESYLFRSRATTAMRGSRAAVILHEMAHMWFGDLVTMKWWGDLWLNESFATFMAVLAQTEATKYPTASRAFAQRVLGSIAADQLSSTHPIVADASDTAVASQNFDPITYGKGAATLRQLRAFVGPDAFRDGVRSYLSKHQWGNATLSDFLGELAAASGKDMNDWSRRWLQAEGINTLTPHLIKSRGAIDSLVITQTADPAHPMLRPHRLGVGLYSLGSDGALHFNETVEVTIDGASTDVSSQLRGHRADAALVNEGGLTFAKVRLDEDSLATFIEHINDVADPLTRLNLANTMWDMVRDAQMPARRYFDVMLSGLGSEPDADSLRSALSKAETAVSCAHPSAREGLLQRLAETARQGMESAVPGSSEQWVYASTYFGTADSAVDRARFERFLSGAEVIPGLTLDVEVRWRLVEAVAIDSPRGPRIIAAEEQRDDTDFGRRNAAMLRAARPTAAAKARAWKVLLEPTAVSSKTLQAVAAGFQRWGQDHLTRMYTPVRYEKLVPVWWKTLSPSRAKVLTLGLFPAAHGDQTMAVGVAERLLSRHDLPVAARRLLGETRENLLRVQRAQAFDLLSLGPGQAQRTLAS